MPGIPRRRGHRRPHGRPRRHAATPRGPEPFPRASDPTGVAPDL